jgi:hypothetical protein
VNELGTSVLLLPQRGWFKGSANRNAVIAHVEVCTSLYSSHQTNSPLSLLLSHFTPVPVPHMLPPLSSIQPLPLSLSHLPSPLSPPLPPSSSFLLQVKLARDVENCALVIVVWSPASVEGAAFSVENSSDVAVSVTQKGVFAPPVPLRSAELTLRSHCAHSMYWYQASLFTPAFVPLFLLSNIFINQFFVCIFVTPPFTLFLISSSFSPPLLRNFLTSIHSSHSFLLPLFRGMTEPLPTTEDNDPARYVLVTPYLLYAFKQTDLSLVTFIFFFFSHRFHPSIALHLVLLYSFGF